MNAQRYPLFVPFSSFLFYVKTHFKDGLKPMNSTESKKMCCFLRSYLRAKSILLLLTQNSGMKHLSENIDAMKSLVSSEMPQMRLKKQFSIQFWGIKPCQLHLHEQSGDLTFLVKQQNFEN